VLSILSFKGGDLQLKIIDTHCDALLKLWQNPGQVQFNDSPELDTNVQRLQKGQVAVQFFAIFIYPEVKSDLKFQVALEQIDYFHSEVLAKNPMMKHVTSWGELDRLGDNEIGAVLTLEGADAFGNDIAKLQTFYRLGVKSIGLTWNNANLCADGAGEPRGAGLTLLGKQVVKLNNEHQIFTDVSHLSEKSFWDVMDLADYPMASHSNARSLCDHPRNLYDEQAQAMFNKGGFIGIVYAPHFVKKDGEATISDVIQHIDHFCSLGGVNHICLGSDFDGITKKVKDLEDSSMYQNLINELLKHYKEDEVKGFAYQNFLNHRPKR
jgi:membrane dipeptidase